MKTKIISINNQRMSSLEIAALTGKPHNDVMKAIRKMEPAWVKIAQGKFSLGSYRDPNNQLRPCYELTKTECLYIATKFNDEARAKLVLRWEQLERQQLGSSRQQLMLPAPERILQLYHHFAAVRYLALSCVCCFHYLLERLSVLLRVQR